MNEECLIKVDYKEIAKKLVRYCARVKDNETVAILGREDNLFFCELIGLQCYKIGAIPQIIIYSDDYRYKTLNETPIKFLKRLPRHLLALIKESDVIITTAFEWEDPKLMSEVTEERIAAKRIGEKPINEAVYDGKRRWLGCSFPTEKQAKAIGINFSELYNMYWDAIDIDYDDLTKKANILASYLEDKDVVRISSNKGTNVEIKISGRKIGKDDGVIDEEDVKRGDPWLNIPSGEVCVAPIEDGANGKVVFDIAYYKGKKIEDLEVELIDGVVKPLKAKKGLEIFTNRIEKASGDKDKIGELGIGLNPKIKNAIGYLATDEKIIGTCHIAFGENRFIGGKNVSDIHWDLLIKNATVVVDDKVIMKNGKFLIF
jgi:aminopeptidase